MEREERRGPHPSTTKYVYDVDVNFFNEKENAKKARKVSAKNRMNIDGI